MTVPDRLARQSPALRANWITWYADAWRHGFRYKGRTTRMEWGMFAAGHLFVSVILWLPIGLWPLAAGAGADEFRAWTWAPLLGYHFAGLIPAASVTARRFHDQGRSGMLVLLAIVPVVGPLLVVALACLPGDRGTNRFGPDPLQARPRTDPRWPDVF